MPWLPIFKGAPGLSRAQLLIPKQVFYKVLKHFIARFDRELGAQVSPFLPASFARPHDPSS